jgi:peroxiredoxin Q/BCP
VSNKESALPAEGSKAPAFSLPSSSGETVKLANLKGRAFVLYFYPKDATSGCTLEAQGFRDLDKEFKKAKVQVLGVSPDSVESHCKFITKEKLSFELLADVDHKVAEKFGVWGEKSMYGRKYMGIFRTTFLIDKHGKIARVWEKVTPRGHAKDVLEAAKVL